MKIFNFILLINLCYIYCIIVYNLKKILICNKLIIALLYNTFMYEESI